VNPDDLSYIEAHGTATPLGDPIELNSLGELLPAGPEAPPCHVGSVKANIGHTETVSGLSGVIKVALMLQHREQYPQIHFETLNPHIKLEGTRLRIATEGQPWDAIHDRRVAGGGVGQAAIQIARSIGAEIIATAGMPEKRAYLHDQGIEHVFDSRATQFADEVLRVTHGTGVDVVLNSLSGDAFPENLRILAAYGRFPELGKTDIYLNRSLGLEQFQNNLSYFAIDMDRAFRQCPELICQLAAELSTQFDDGSYGRLPITVFPIDDVVAAFRFMSQRKNIGKIVVTMPTAERATPPVQSSPPIRGDGTYLITGGLGDLGLRVADWLAARGATTLVLMSRRGPRGAAAETVKQLQSRGVRLQCLSGDVSQHGDVARIITMICETLPPLRGVFHLAGELDDGVLVQMTPERFERVLAPKANGAWHLHVATRELPLDYFVLFSSAASLLGSSGQGNYAAANAFLDSLAHWRRAQGLPAMAINWGECESGGMASTPLRRDELAHRGFGLLSPEVALTVLDRLLAESPPQAAVMAVDWETALRPLRQHVPAIVADFATAPARGAEPSAKEPDFLVELMALPVEWRRDALTEHFRQKLAQVTGLEPAAISTSQPLNELGLDSLMVFELKNAI
jgi:phthiocerol/phenolphthiocerol synthesis type-I polyketide synthase C